MAIVRLKPGHVQPVWAGHPWVYAQAIDRVEGKPGAGDEVTVARVAGRQALRTGWVSYQLQELVAELWSDPSVARVLDTAARTYADRGAAVRSALRDQGIAATGRSGFARLTPTEAGRP